MKILSKYLSTEITEIVYFVGNEKKIGANIQKFNTSCTKVKIQRDSFKSFEFRRFVRRMVAAKILSTVCSGIRM